MSTHDVIVSSVADADRYAYRDTDYLPDGGPDDTDEVDEIEVELVVLALAGTTVVDDGLVERACARALDRAGIAVGARERVSALVHLRDNSGRGRREIFLELADDDDQAARASAEFERAFAELADREGVEAIPGAQTAIERLRANGVHVALTTGLSRTTTNGILDALGWHDLVDVVLCSDDVRRGRPYPDLALTALLRTGATSVDGMIVVGDSVSDIASGLAAGAGVTVGVLTGAHDERALTLAGADAVIDGIADLPMLLGLDADPADHTIYFG